jgi:hypothetical protein
MEADGRQHRSRQQTADRRQQKARHQTADSRQQTADSRQQTATDHSAECAGHEDPVGARDAVILSHQPGHPRHTAHGEQKRERGGGEGGGGGVLPFCFPIIERFLCMRERNRERKKEDLNTIPPMSNKQIRKIAPTPLSAVWSYARN